MNHQQRIRLEILIEDATQAAVNLDRATTAKAKADAKLRDYTKELETEDDNAAKNV